ncbi:hypothetical protein [Acinetobacter soli]|uniref:hypothetical protein n=1 Tax=Acinetobacter soli TaxID=487316 RepID=UPI00124FAFEC|nr:hypothetical protein [Acinetobacter soli]
MIDFLIFLKTEFIFTYSIISIFISILIIYFIYRLFVFLECIDFKFIRNYRNNRKINKIEQIIDSDDIEKSETKTLKYKIKTFQYQKMLGIDESSLMKLLSLSTYDDVQSAIKLYKKSKSLMTLNKETMKFELSQGVEYIIIKNQSNDFFALRFLSCILSFTLLMTYFFVIYKKLPSEHIQYGFLTTVFCVMLIIFITEFYISNKNSYRAAFEFSNLSKIDDSVIKNKFGDLFK